MYMEANPIFTNTKYERKKGLSLCAYVCVNTRDLHLRIATVSSPRCYHIVHNDISLTLGTQVNLHPDYTTPRTNGIGGQLHKVSAEMEQTNKYYCR
jgi:hypothetical protein